MAAPDRVLDRAVHDGLDQGPQPVVEITGIADGGRSNTDRAAVTPRNQYVLPDNLEGARQGVPRADLELGKVGGGEAIGLP